MKKTTKVKRGVAFTVSTIIKGKPFINTKIESDDHTDNSRSHTTESNDVIGLSGGHLVTLALISGLFGVAVLIAMVIIAKP